MTAELTIAKTLLSSALFRPDPRSCTQDDIEAMVALLDEATTQCSPANVQKCKRWALENLTPSSSRMSPFAKYLVALSNSFVELEKKQQAQKRPCQSRPSAKRRRLYLLYVINDILFHVKTRLHDDSFAAKLAASLPTLVQNASSFSDSPKQIEKVRDLITLWEQKNYFAAGHIEKLWKAVDDGLSGQGKEVQHVDSSSYISKGERLIPYVMPATHGHPSMPWYDLPAGNWLSVMEPNSTRPMNPLMIKPLQLTAGPATKSLVDAVKTLLVEVDGIYSDTLPEDDPNMDIGPLGERVELDEMTKEAIGGNTYYGWSRQFCNKMKDRRRENRHIERGRSREGRALSSRSYSPPRSCSSEASRRRYGRGSSRSSSRPVLKRPRYSSGSDRSVSRSLSRTRDGHGSSKDSFRGRQRSRSGPGRRSRCRSKARQGRASISPRRSKSRSYSPPWHMDSLPPKRPPGPLPQPPNQALPNVPFTPWLLMPPPNLIPQPHANMQDIPQSGLPLPSISPATMQGQWPPAPPPLPHLGVPPPPMFDSFGGWPVLPQQMPPLPPEQQHQQQSQYWNNGNNFYNGRGGRGAFGGVRGDERGGGCGRGGWSFTN